MLATGSKGLTTLPHAPTGDSPALAAVDRPLAAPDLSGSAADSSVQVTPAAAPAGANWSSVAKSARVRLCSSS